MKLLIIGIRGFVGRNLYEYFSSINGYDVEGITSAQLNLLDERAVYEWLKNKKYDMVIHAAVYNPRINIYSQRENKELEYDLRMFYNIAKYHDLYDKMIYFGSGAEYDKRFPIVSVKEDEWEREIPTNDYGFAKYLINQYIEKSHNIYNLRIFGLFGKYENWKTTFISGACCKALKELPITIRRNVYFDYLYIGDFCKMLDRFLQIEKPKYHSYNIVSGRKVDLISLAEMVKVISGKDVPIIVCQDGMSNEYTADNSRLLSEIGAFKLTSFDNAIKELYQWYEVHQSEIDLLSLLY